MNKITNQKYQETYYTRVLNSGMKVIAMPKIPSYTTYVSLMFPFAAKHLTYELNNEIKVLPEGIAHFFEHKIYASKTGDMFTQFVSLGLDANAMTGYEMTQYIFSATSHVFEGIDLLLETVDHPYFTDQNVLKERDIINEEIQMNNDRLYTKMFRHLRQNMYVKHPIKTDILGTKETIANITKELLTDVHQHFYQDHQRMLLISGNIDIESLDQYLDTLEHRKKCTYHPRFIEVNEPPTCQVHHQVIEENITHQMLMYGIKLSGLSKGLMYEKEMSALFMLLHGLFGSSSTLSQAFLDKQLVKKEISYHVERLSGAEAVVIYAETDSPELLIDAINDVLKSPMESHITVETFERFKRVNLANQIEMLDNQEQKIELFAQYELEGLDLFDVLDIKNELNFEDLIKMYERIKACDVSTLILKPTK